MVNLPRQRWQFPPQFEGMGNSEIGNSVSSTPSTPPLPPLVQKILYQRGLTTPSALAAFCDPEQFPPPSPLSVFPDLALAAQLLAQAITQGQSILICGDYDADGMTSTALLLRAILALGGTVSYAIPSRMGEGYGINQRIVRESVAAGIGLILTVDNGIAAYEAIALAVESGLTVIITDHHDLPEQLPPAQAILNPKLLPPDSVYRGLAGVGVAYVLAVTTAQQLGGLTGLTAGLLDLFTLGTIADLAPVGGVNRRWLRRGLAHLPQSPILGIQALMEVANIDPTSPALTPDDIGFKLGPRINAVGRIGDPQVIIDLLTTDDPQIAHPLAFQCEHTNLQRQNLCRSIEQAAIALVETKPLKWQDDWVLTPLHSDWHHGVIGIVAGRLVERYGVPVFMATIEEDGQTVRGSARSIPEFDVFKALDSGGHLLHKYGGHPAAGGFSLALDQWPAFEDHLRQFAHGCLAPHLLQPLVKVDVQAELSDLTLSLVQTLEALNPWGIGNPPPVFFSSAVHIRQQRLMGKDRSHLGLTFGQGSTEIRAVAWGWGEFYPLPSPLDVVYRLKKNVFRGQTSVQMELLGARLAE